MTETPPAGATHEPVSSSLELQTSLSAVGVVHLIGEFDALTQHHAQTELTSVITATAGEVLLIDCSELTFVDSSGLSVLCAAQDFAMEHGKRIALVKRSDTLDALLHLTALVDLLVDPAADSSHATVQSEPGVERDQA